MARFLKAEAPERQDIIEGMLPANVVGLLGGAGGSGKTHLLMQLGLSVTSGLPWVGREVKTAGSVFVFTTEDDEHEIHRRVRRIADQYFREYFEDDLGGWRRFQESVARRLFIYDRCGGDNRLISVDRQGARRSDFASHVIGTVNQVDDPVLVILDPLSRFDSGDQNDNADATRLIEVVEEIRKETGAAVLLSHHVTKPSKNQPEPSQADLRGASAFVDGARWVALLSPARSAETKAVGVRGDPNAEYVSLSVVKGNYAPTGATTLLKREGNGVLSAVSSSGGDEQGQGRAQRADAEYKETLARIVKLLHDKGPLPKRKISDTHGGTEGYLGVGQKRVRQAVERALKLGDLRTVPGQDRQRVVALPLPGPSGQAGSGH